MIERWPFTNFHDLNLDWIITTIKKLDSIYNTGLYDFVEKVLANHPEWTTTIQDGAITSPKINTELWDVLDEKYDNQGVDFELIMPKMTYSGTCILIKTNDNVIMIDTGPTEDEAELLAAMGTHAISHIDTLIITHFHLDHVGNVLALISNGFIDSDTVVYYPVDPVWVDMIDNDNYYPAIETRKTTIINALTVSAGSAVNPVTYEFETATAGDLKLIFNNASLLTYNNYYNVILNGGDLSNFDHTNYNNFSMITTIKNGDRYYLFPADIEYAAQEIQADNIGKNFDIVLTSHHDSDIIASEKFWSMLTAKFGIQMGVQNRGANACGNMILNSGIPYYMEYTGTGDAVIKYKNGAYEHNLVNLDVYQSYYNRPDKVIVAGDDLNDYTTPGSYYSRTGSEGLITNEPPVNKTYRLDVRIINRNDGGRCQQDVYTRDGVHFRRYKTSIGGALGWVSWRTVDDLVRSVSSGGRVTVPVDSTYIKSGSIYIEGGQGVLNVAFRTVRTQGNLPAGTVFATIPEAYRPQYSRNIPFSLYGDLHGMLAIATNGNLSFTFLSRDITASDYLGVDFVYIPGMTTYTNVD